jgi:hypothetical protein
MSEIGAGAIVNEISSLHDLLERILAAQVCIGELLATRAGQCSVYDDSEWAECYNKRVSDVLVELHRLGETPTSPAN